MVVVKKSRFFVVVLVITLLFGTTTPVQAGFWSSVCSAFNAVIELVGAALDTVLAPVRDFLKNAARDVMATANQKAQVEFKKKVKDLVVSTKKSLLDKIDTTIGKKFTEFRFDSVFPDLKKLKGSIKEYEQKLNNFVNKEVQDAKESAKKECVEIIDKCSQFLEKITLELLDQFIQNVTAGLIAKIDAKVRA